MSFLFPNHCSMCDWISIYDHIIMLTILLFHVYLIIIALYVVILVWGRYNSFSGLLEQEEREEQEDDWSSAWINLHLAKVWTILISETCLYLPAEPFSSTFQPQYVDGLLNPSHRILSFTTLIDTKIHYSHVEKLALATVHAVQRLRHYILLL